MYLTGIVEQDSVQAGAEGREIRCKANKMGNLIVQDFYTQMAIEGRIYQVKAGTITAPITGDIEITDTAAEMCADAAAGYTIIPVYLNVSCEVKGTALPECAAKSVGAVSTVGTAFVPLPLYIGGVAAGTTARAMTAGGVTVAAEVATTTRVHWTTVLTAIADWQLATKRFRVPPVLPGPACFYVQVAAGTAGPTYFAHFDYIELPTTAVA